jgi:hypothetical protein
MLSVTIEHKLFMNFGMSGIIAARPRVAKPRFISN